MWPVTCEAWSFKLVPCALIRWEECDLALGVSVGHRHTYPIFKGPFSKGINDLASHWHPPRSAIHEIPNQTTLPSCKYAHCKLPLYWTPFWTDPSLPLVDTRFPSQPSMRSIWLQLHDIVCIPKFLSYPQYSSITLFVSSPGAEKVSSIFRQGNTKTQRRPSLMHLSESPLNILRSTPLNFLHFRRLATLPPPIASSS